MFFVWCCVTWYGEVTLAYVILSGVAITLPLTPTREPCAEGVITSDHIYSKAGRGVLVCDYTGRVRMPEPNGKLYDTIQEWLEPRAEWVHARTRAEVLESIHALGDMRSVPQWLSYLLLASIGESDPLWHRMLQRISFVAVAREEESPSEVCSAWRERLPSSVSLFVSVDGSYPEGSCPLYSCRPAERGTHLHRAVLAWCLLSSDRFHDVLHSCLMEQERNPTTSALLEQAEDVLFHGEDD